MSEQQNGFVHELRLVPKTNIPEMIINWMFYTGLGCVLLKLAGIGEFKHMQWWQVTFAWWLPLAMFFVVMLITLVITIMKAATRDTDEIEVKTIPLDNDE